MLRIAFAPLYKHFLPEGHRFPMMKYPLIPEQLMYEGTITSDNIFTTEIDFAEEESIVLRTHDAHFWQKLKTLSLDRLEERRMGFPQSEALVRRELLINKGTRLCCDYALQYGVALNVSGGTHHAYTNRAEGFCLLNDIAMAANHLLDSGKVKKILVIDLDVHQGNGTAEIFRNEPRVFTFSMHGANNYPLHKERSDLDLPLPDGTDDDTYLRLLKNTLPRLMDEVQPDFAFFQSGVDVLATDRLGRLGLSLVGCKERDRIVWQTCKDNGVPVVAVMGGGYSPRLADIVEAHCNTFRTAAEVFF
jgi:acetoin utilization deacetylase AcuC-like enzyme